MSKIIRIVKDCDPKQKRLCEVVVVKVIKSHPYFTKTLNNYSIIDYGNGVAQVNNKTLYTKEEAINFINKFLEELKMTNKIKIGNLYSSKILDVQVRITKIDGEYIFYEYLGLKDRDIETGETGMRAWIFERDYRKFSFKESFEYHWYRLGLNKSWGYFVPLVGICAAYIYYNYFSG